MILAGGVGVVLIIGAVLAQDNMETNPPNGDLRDYDNQEWKAMDYYSPLSATSGWVPHEETEDQAPKRRRIRKRKRRPPMMTDQDEITTTRRRTRLDQIREPWEDMGDEISQRSNNRRRLTPIYDETEAMESKSNYEKIRDPFTALQEAEEKQKNTMEEANPPDLKTLLKQSGGVSLSEVLQQKNLSLSELLRGNQQAISALAEVSTEANKYRRPPSIKRNDDAIDSLSSHEALEAQRKRLKSAVTEATTERRIFVPSNSKSYTSMDYKLDVVLISSTTTKPVSIRPKELPVTSARLNKAKSPREPKIPPQAMTISINEIFGFTPPNATKISDGPFKMTIDLEEITTTVKPPEKLTHVTAKDEIMEILRNPADRAYLSRILKTRNMTVEQLVEQRERGSSQLHLADIFHNKTKEPEPKDDNFVVGHISDGPSFNRKPKSRTMTTDPPIDKEIVTTQPQQYTITSFPTYKIEMNKNLKQQPFLPVWKQLYPSFFTDVHESGSRDDKREFVQTVTTTEKMSYDDVVSLEDIENTLAEAANGKFPRQNMYDDDDNQFINLPSGVKSAILASLAIIGLSLLVFLTILVIFKWSQKQRGRLNYTGSFSGSKIKSPILEPVQKRSFRTFMTETLGRKKNYYKAHLQNMSDTIWDNDEKKSYMI